MKVLVTGAGGYIGSVLTQMLIDEGHEVIAYDRFFFGSPKWTIPNGAHPVKVVKNDVRNPIYKDILISEEGPDAIIDLVAISNDPSGEQFSRQTHEINCRARIASAVAAEKYGVKRYILPSSCSIYGFQGEGVVVDEMSETNPLTTYARENLRAEYGVLERSSKSLCVTVLRQSTVFGLSPRMRFDLAINNMTWTAWSEGKITVTPDGMQWRPMVHVRDTASAMMFMLTAPVEKINGQVFNVGSDENNYQMLPLAVTISNRFVELGRNKVSIEWKGDPDFRSYRVGFRKIKELGWSPSRTVQDAVDELVEAMDNGLTKTVKTVTLDWYRTLIEWNKEIQRVAWNGEIL